LGLPVFGSGLGFGLGSGEGLAIADFPEDNKLLSVLLVGLGLNPALIGVEPIRFVMTGIVRCWLCLFVIKPVDIFSAGLCSLLQGVEGEIARALESSWAHSILSPETAL
jgi:hypothetical protein